MADQRVGGKRGHGTLFAGSFPADSCSQVPKVNSSHRVVSHFLYSYRHKGSGDGFSHCSPGYFTISSSFSHLSHHGI